FPAHAEAITRAYLLFFPKDAFIGLITRHPTLAVNIIAVLSLRLHQFAGQVESLSLKEVPNRLAAYLIYLSEEQRQKDSVTLSISKGQLASLLGTIPETLSRIFGRMTEQGLIEVDGKRIHLLDRESLKDLSDR
ncbi:MAG: Crp/Fnr family transcriptional regulator, partial [Thermodesulfobacteriota bacterium]